MPEFAKALPSVTAANAPFWEAARRHELLVYRCRSCGAFPVPGGKCTACGESETEWLKASGRGEVYTFVVFRQPFHPAWAADVPYNAACVKLEEGPLLLTSIVECEHDSLAVGMPVAVVFDDVSPDVTLPKFRPVR
jgi:uncharacterized OB-fold protein